jgi:hypothetical protein
LAVVAFLTRAQLRLLCWRRCETRTGVLNVASTSAPSPPDAPSAAQSSTPSGDSTSPCANASAEPGAAGRPLTAVVCASGSGSVLEVADPVSWLQIEQGWNVVASDEVVVGTVAQVEGDKRPGCRGG